MAEYLKIGLNLQTALLINGVVIFCAFVLTREVSTTSGRALKSVSCVSSLSLLTWIVVNVPHQPLF